MRERQGQMCVAGEASIVRASDLGGGGFEVGQYSGPKKEGSFGEAQRYEVRAMKPGESPRVSELFRLAYGYSYGNPAVYRPDRFERLVKGGRIVSMVTVARGHGIVGHNALVRSNICERTAEAAMAVVHPDFRRRGLQALMIQRLAEEARKMGLRGIGSKSVTSHVFAQRAGIKAGFKRCALVVGLVPTHRRYRGIHSGLSQRESVFCGFLPFPDPRGVVVYPPVRHREFIEKVYAGIGLSRTFRYGEGAAISEGWSSVRTTIAPSSGRAVIDVRRYGKDIIRRVTRTLKGLLSRNVEQVTLRLNLEDPLTAAVFSKVFEDMGFFIGGVLPCGKMGDTLILQYLNNVSIDYDRIQTFSEPALEILSYVRDHDPHNS